MYKIVSSDTEDQRHKTEASACHNITYLRKLSIIRTLSLFEMARALAEPYATELTWQYCIANK
jgi:hypothetical protein